MKRMEAPLRLIIADDEPFICGMLEKLIDFQALGLELAGRVNDGETLEKKIDELRPDIVLTDISMPREDGLDVIRKTRERGIGCRFVIISGYRQFEYAFNALKYKVDDYLLKPVEKAELNQVLRKICDEIRQVVPSDDDVRRRRQHAYLLEKGIHKELRSDSVPLADINRSFKVNFAKGCFRMAAMKLDFTREENQHGEDVSSVLDKLCKIGCGGLQEYCAEVICRTQQDRVEFLMNYDKAKDDEIRRRLNGVYARAKQVIELFQGLNLTLCVGKAVDRLCYAEQTKLSCQRAVWLRLRMGINRVLFEESVEDTEIGGYKNHVNNIREGLEKSYTAMDTKAMAVYFKQFFALPPAVLFGTQAMQFIRQNLTYLRERYVLVTKDAGNVDEIMAELVQEVEMQTSLAAYEKTLVEKIDGLLTKMSGFVREKNVKPVMRATAYIEAHYAEHITLETLAELVSLNPIYFSNLFKREVGRSFTEYLTEYRMKKAKEMLRGNEMNINEIADALGYTDARYFSKVFKKEIGVKPTDYRKIYG